MNVVFILPGYPRVPGGGHKVVYQHANFLARHGHDVQVLHLRPRKPGDAERRYWRVAALRLAYALGRHARPKWFSLDPRVSVRNASSQAVRYVRQCDVLVATSARTAEFVARAAPSVGARGYYFIQGFEDFAAKRGLVEATWRLPLAKVVVSRWLADLAHSLGEDAVVAANAPDLDLFRPGRAMAERPLGLLSMVSDQPWKRTDLVCHVMARLSEEWPEVELHAFGVCARPEELPRSVSYRRSPSPGALAEAYGNARVFLFTSDSEGFGLPVAEALASGCAVVSTATEGVKSFAGDDVIYAPLGDGNALLAGVRRLLSDVELCSRVASSGMARVRAYGPDDAGMAFMAALMGDASSRERPLGEGE